MQAPSSTTESGIVSLRELIDFTSHVADCYPEATAKFPDELRTIISLHHKELESELREKIVGSLILLRRKDVIDSSTYVYLCLYVRWNSNNESVIDYFTPCSQSLLPHLANH